MDYKNAQKTILISECSSLLKEFGGNWSLIHCHTIEKCLIFYCVCGVCTLRIGVVVIWKVSMFLPLR